MYREPIRTIHFAFVPVLLALISLAGCRPTQTVPQAPQESLEAKKLLQGVWIDEESEMVAFKMQGDTIYYADSTSAPACFRVMNDTLVVGDTEVKYPIVKQMEHMFWFKTINGDLVKLVKSTSDDDASIFAHKKQAKVLTVSSVLKTDTVVEVQGERYHCYVAINPSKYKVVKTSYNDDGLQVENVYYDNIIHLSVFRGAARVYSHDFRKQMFAKLLPAGLIDQVVLGNLEYDGTDKDGIRFTAAIGIPDEASSYQVSVTISSSGKMTMKKAQ